MNDRPATASFDTTLTAFGNNTGIVVPPDALEQLGAGRRPPVDVDLNGHQYRSTIGAMNGQSLVSVSAAIRTITGLAAGDPIHVTLTLDQSPRAVELPDEFEAALRAHPGTHEFFDTLSNSLQRYHIDQITGATTDETRKRRVDKAVGLFLEGKKR